MLLSVALCAIFGCTGIVESAPADPSISEPEITTQETPKTAIASLTVGVTLPPISILIDLRVHVDISPPRIREVDLLLTLDVPPVLQWLQEPRISLFWVVLDNTVTICGSAIGYKVCYASRDGFSIDRITPAKPPVPDPTLAPAPTGTGLSGGAVPI